MSRLNLAGRRFGRLVPIKPTRLRSGGAIKWVCECRCGRRTTTSSSSLRSGHSRSCGCLHRERAAEQINKNRPRISPCRKHGGTCDPMLVPTYRAYRAMINRCYDRNASSYRYYGATGVKVSDRWIGDHGFEQFLEDVGVRPPGTTLGRYFDIGWYEKGNCRWMSRAEQIAEQNKKRKIFEAIVRQAANKPRRKRK